MKELGIGDLDAVLVGDLHADWVAFTAAKARMKEICRVHPTGTLGTMPTFYEVRIVAASTAGEGMSVMALFIPLADTFVCWCTGHFSIPVRASTKTNSNDRPTSRSFRGSSTLTSYSNSTCEEG